MSDDYSPGEPDYSPPLELEATTEDTRTPEAGTAVEGLTVTEAASAYGLSVITVRRLVTSGKLAGAAKVSGPKGSAWRIPPEALENLGYRPQGTRAAAAVAAARANLEVEEMRRQVVELMASLDLERTRREAAETRATDLEANLADLRTAIEIAETALAKLPAAIEAPKRRRFFRKGRSA